MSTLDEILGKRVDGQLIREIKETLQENDQVLGAYDLTLHAYGPNLFIGSVHVEVPSTMTAVQLDLLERDLTEKIYQKHHVYLSAIGIYSVEVENECEKQVRQCIQDLLVKYPQVMQLHGFVLDEKNKRIHFDLIFDFADESDVVSTAIKKEIMQLYPGYMVSIQQDLNVDL